MYFNNYDIYYLTIVITTCQLTLKIVGLLQETVKNRSIQWVTKLLHGPGWAKYSR